MIINKSNETKLSGFYIVYKGSVNLEKKGWYGISHLMEHLKCKCFDDLMDSFQEDGVTWNAYTTNNEIVFHFTGLERCIAKYRDIIIERMYKPFSEYITDEMLKNEIKIVLKEYNQCFTGQDDTFYYNFMRRNYSCYSAIGLKEDIENITYQDCLDFYELQYKYPDCIINISKDFEYSNDLLKFEDRSNCLRNDWSVNNDAKLEKSITTDNTTILYYNQNIDKDDIVYISLINSMLSSGLNSPLYQEIREKRGLCYSIGTYLQKIGVLNTISLYVMTSPDSIDELEVGLNTILDNKEEYLTLNRFNLVKNSLLIKKEKGEINAHSSIASILDNTVDELYKLIENVTMEDIYKVYDKYFTLSKFSKHTDKEY